MNIKFLVIEYEEGCGYNSCTTIDDFPVWASRRPFNRVEMQRRVDRFHAEYPDVTIEQQMVYSPPFAFEAG